MRYPAACLISLILLATPVRAASYASAAQHPASSPAPAPAATSAAAPVASAGTKIVPVTAPVDVFNGKDMTGWSYIIDGKLEDITKVCTVKDGVMVCTGTPNGYIVLAEPRANYQLHFEWRWPTSNPKNNGGALINISDGPLQEALWPVCFQAQLKTLSAGDFLMMSTAACAEGAAGKTTVKQKASSEKPVGEWNAADIVVRGDTITYTVNGVLQNTATKCVPSSGKIGFQIEGYPYEMRNLKLTPLPAATP